MIERRDACNPCHHHVSPSQEWKKPGIHRPGFFYEPSQRSPIYSYRCTRCLTAARSSSSNSMTWWLSLSGAFCYPVAADYVLV